MKRNGFTIVELLIVVVVIAILAAITIASYNGITNRAKTANLLSAVDVYQKTLMQHKAVHGLYPITGVLNSSSYSVCLGETPAADPIPANYCLVIDSPDGNGGSELVPLIPTHEPTNTALSAFITALPNAQSAVLAYESEGIPVYIRGIIYYPALDGLSARVQYVTPPDQTCGRGERSSLPTDPGGVSMPSLCTINLN